MKAERFVGTFTRGARKDQLTLYWLLSLLVPLSLLSQLYFVGPFPKYTLCSGNLVSISVETQLRQPGMRAQDGAPNCVRDPRRSSLRFKVDIILPTLQMTN